MSKVIIRVEGGLIQDIHIPNDIDVEVEVRDYDVEGVGGSHIDSDGEECFVCNWSNDNFGIDPNLLPSWPTVTEISNEKVPSDNKE